MSDRIEIKVPDIGDSHDVEIIEILVSVGDQVAVDQSLLTLESDKASMEVPATHAGVIESLAVSVGDTVNTGDLIGHLSQTDGARVDSQGDAAGGETASAGEAGQTLTVAVPDIGDVEGVKIIEILVAAGDEVAAEQSLVTLESDKASMEVPCPQAGTVLELLVSVDDAVSEGDALLRLSTASTTASTASATGTSNAPVPASTSTPAPSPSGLDGKPGGASAAGPTASRPPAQSSPTAHLDDETIRKAHASPGVRRYAREHGANLMLVRGSGPKGRILKDDVTAFIKQAMEGAGSAYGSTAQGVAGGGAGIPPIPEVDFTKFGEVERVELGRINKLSAANLHRAWLNLPMVTHHDEADITELEAFRKQLNGEARGDTPKVTALAFHMKALAATLKVYPKLNSSLSADGQALFYKKYCHIGIAVDTPAGLVVPVFRDVDSKSVMTLAAEMAEMSQRARDKKLRPDEMQGASMTISSIGGIGGTAFTPIVNPPEVAILGITRARMQPVWNGQDFEPRLMCPLDLTYDHRVVDGADAARFMAHYCQSISDIRRLLL